MSGGIIARPTTAIPEDEVQRYNFAERAYHWINAIAYTYLMLTGLAILKSSCAVTKFRSRVESTGRLTVFPVSLM